MRGVLSSTPFDLIDLLFNLQGFEVVELGLMGLKLGMELVFARLLLFCVALHISGAVSGRPCCLGSATNRLIPLEQHHPTPLVTGREIVSRLIELDGGDDVGYRSKSAR